MEEQFPQVWRDAIVSWAANVPLVESLYLFGSRAKGCARPDSDIDLAYRVRANSVESPFIIAMFEGNAWRKQLEALLPVPVDFQYADPDADDVVWPAVLDHGIRLV